MTLRPDEGIAILAQLAGSVTRSPTARTARAATTDTLARVEARFRALVEQIPAVTFGASLDGGLNEVYVSPQIETLLGFKQDEWIANPVLWFQQLHPDDRDMWNREFARGCATDGHFRAECRFFARDGHIVWVHGEARLVKDDHGVPIFLQGVAFDITDAKRAEEIVRASLREKELLLKEIHHRVKNNLQVTSSLLTLQSNKIDDPGARRVLKESQDRIRSMALVHEMLYRSVDFARVDFAEYTRSLVSQLFQSQGGGARKIALKTELDRVELSVDEAIPCGLIMNELLSNALKYAFPNQPTGQIWVKLRALPQSRCELVVGDDGAGLPPQFDVLKTETLGLQLVRTLAAQLGGTVSVSVERGTEFSIVFPTRTRLAEVAR